VTEFTQAERDLLALPVPCLALDFLPLDASDADYETRSELLGYTGPDALCPCRGGRSLRALMRLFGITIPNTRLIQ
jgi:hypothetical protein